MAWRQCLYGEAAVSLCEAAPWERTWSRALCSQTGNDSWISNQRSQGCSQSQRLNATSFEPPCRSGKPRDLLLHISIPFSLCEKSIHQLKRLHLSYFLFLHSRRVLYSSTSLFFRLFSRSSHCRPEFNMHSTFITQVLALALFAAPIVSGSFVVCNPIASSRNRTDKE